MNKPAKACPFCGAEPMERPDDEEGYWMMCQTPTCPLCDNEICEEDWNRRATPPIAVNGLFTQDSVAFLRWEAQHAREMHGDLIAESFDFDSIADRIEQYLSATPPVVRWEDDEMVKAARHALKKRIVDHLNKAGLSLEVDDGESPELDAICRAVAACGTPDVCSVCAGTGKPISGKPCICGGAGTIYAELQGFRERVYDLEAVRTPDAEPLPESVPPEAAREGETQYDAAIQWIGKAHHLDKCAHRDGGDCNCGKQWLIAGPESRR